jgi:splicing factor 3B subunit 2
MGLTTAERSKRKRERKKRDREEQRRLEETRKDSEGVKEDVDVVEVEYVAEPIATEGGDAFESLRRFQERVSDILVTDEDDDDEQKKNRSNHLHDGEGDFAETDENGQPLLSRRKLRDMVRPSVSNLKRQVQRPDLVEAHDVTSTDPVLLIQLKAVPGTVPVPRHWGRKRKYLQGKVSLVGVTIPFAVSTFISLVIERL